MTPERMKEIDESVEYFYERTGIAEKKKTNKFDNLTSDERINMMIELSNKLLSNINWNQTNFSSDYFKKY